MKRLSALIFSLCLGTGIPLAAAAASGDSALKEPEASIIGGEPAPSGAYPFFTALVQEDGSHVCGAALIAPQWVLTASHCMRGYTPHSVLIGLERYRPDVVALDNIPIASIYTHPQDDYEGQFDIALVKLARPAESEHFMKLDGMEFHLEINVGDPVWLVGFGKNETGYGPDVLYQAQGHVLENNACIDVPEGYPDTNFNPENNICAGYNQASGDSGGPLMYRVNNSYVEVGLVSRTLWLRAGQYTRVAYFADWIKQTMEQNK